MTARLFAVQGKEILLNNKIQRQDNKLSLTYTNLQNNTIIIPKYITNDEFPINISWDILANMLNTDNINIKANILIFKNKILKNEKYISKNSKFVFKCNKYRYKITFLDVVFIRNAVINVYSTI